MRAQARHGLAEAVQRYAEWGLIEEVGRWGFETLPDATREELEKYAVRTQLVT